MLSTLTERAARHLEQSPAEHDVRGEPGQFARVAIRAGRVSRHRVSRRRLPWLAAV